VSLLSQFPFLPCGLRVRDAQLAPAPASFLAAPPIYSLALPPIVPIVLLLNSKPASIVVFAQDSRLTEPFLAAIA